MAQVNGIVVWTEGSKTKRLPQQRKTQRDKLVVLAATMLHVGRANSVELAADPSTSSGADPSSPRPRSPIDTRS
jgi:hypothetical protein